MKQKGSRNVIPVPKPVITRCGHRVENGIGSEGLPFGVWDSDGKPLELSFAYWVMQNVHLALQSLTVLAEVAAQHRRRDARPPAASVRRMNICE